MPADVRTDASRADLPRPFRRLAIVNRGEAAMRLIHAVREFNAEHGADVRTIAVHTAAERSAMFVREADEAVALVPTGAGSPYLDHVALRHALLSTHADAVWVGWGFVAEDPAFVDLCTDLGITFIGPSADVMRRLGHKIEAKLEAEAAAIPVAAWSGGAVATVDEAASHAAAIGYPLMIKAAAGGGGRGIRMVTRPDDLAEAFERARAEAARSFGDDTVFIERLLTDVRHVEAQIIADDHGTVWCPGVRDCSVQRHNQKVIEESSSTALAPAEEEAVRSAAVALARRTGYRNAGTVEFLYQPATQTLAFLEINPRLQVEHPVTELTTGIDLVKLQLLVAMGGRLGDAPPAGRGHAIEARLNAEDPERGFAPSPGLVEVLSLPSGPGVRVDTGIAAGDVIPPEFDSMVAKVIAWGQDRDEARARLERALRETTVLIADGTTNRAFLLDLLQRGELRSGNVDTRWLDRLTASAGGARHDGADVALVVAAIEAAAEAESARRAAFLATAARGRPELATTTGDIVELRHRGQRYRAHVVHVGPDRYDVTADGVTVEATVHHLAPWERRVQLGHATHRAVVQRQGADQLVDVDGVTFRFSFDDGGVVRAPAAAVVVMVHAHEGAVVAAGDPLVVVEAMKMEVTITAPTAGRVREVLATANVQVPAGAPLVRIEPAAPDEADAGTQLRIVLEESPAAGPARLPAGGGTTEEGLRLLETLRSSLLGFELTPDQVEDVVERYRLVRPAAADATLVRAELALLTVFADLSVLWRNRSGDTAGEEEEARGPSEFLNTYLRSLDVDREGLPAAFRARLERALAHYGVTDLRRSPALEEALYWLFQAQRRAPIQLPAVLALLEHRMETAATMAPQLHEEFRQTLDRLIVATQLRYPVIGDVARNIRYRWFDEPVIRAAAARDLHDMRAHLAELDAGTGERAAHLEVLVACAQPVLSLLAERAPQGQHLEPMLEVLTRRFYKIRALTDVRAGIIEGRNVVTARYRHDGRTVNVYALHVDESDLDRAAAAIAAASRRVPAGETAVVDVYVATGDDGARLPARVQELLADHTTSEALTRVTVTLLEPGGDGGMRATHATYRRQPDGRFSEDSVLRGLHPMIARRLHLWRLANFRTERLASPPDAYLFRCTAPDNPRDQRFIAVSEVRDLTPVRDADGKVVALPDLEHVLTACLEGLRRAQADLPANRRLAWNRVLLHLWPTSDVPLDELLPIAGRIVPLTVGLGLEAVHVQGRFAVSAGEPVEERVLRLAYQPGTGLTIQVTPPPTSPMQPLDRYTQKVIEARRRGTVYPFEIVPLLTGASGTFVEYDLDGDGALTPTSRQPGHNEAGVIVGVVTTPTERYPEGMTRVALFGDPTKSLGSIAEAECRRVIAALDLAEELDVPVEWFALSAGAKIAMDSGTENLDWVARALRRIIGFTQAGGEINVVVAGINVGAQPYWNAEATMLMHTRGILVMTPQSAMVLTGKQALEYSGGVSAEDNAGIGGYERIMGPNGQAQYWAPDLAGACEVLLHHLEYSYVAPGEPGPRRAATTDPHDRDVSTSPHRVEGSDFTTVGDIFSEASNPGRKKPFDIRTLMRATLDADRPPLERWAHMHEADTVVVLDGHLGGRPVSMLGVESRPMPRFGGLPADGPDQWTAGTLFPLSSKKMARAINAASGTRPLVILANLTGFDGSPESLRRLQLEYGAEIGRAIVNFDGPIVFCVISRYHGGAFVVFSGMLNDRMQVLAVEGSHASVIGGAPAAAVVFTGEVNARVRQDPRVVALEGRIAAEAGGDDGHLRAELARLLEAVRLEKLGEVAAEFDAIHTVERAQRVGSVDEVVPARQLRPRLIDAVERGVGAPAGSSRSLPSP